MKKKYFSSTYPPLASTTASNFLWAFSLIAHNISASVSSHAVIWLKCFCLKMFLWHPWLQKAYFFQYKHHLPSPWPLTSCEVFFQNASNTSSSFLNALRYFDSVQKWPFYKHAYDDMSIHCGGYLNEAQNLFDKIFSWIPKN